MVPSLDYRLINGFNVFVFLGPLEQSSVEKIFRHIEELSKNKKIILDLSKVSFVNSTFIGYMYHLFETNKDIGYMCFVNAHPSIKDAFNLTGVFDIIPYFKDLDTAFQKILKSK